MLIGDLLQQWASWSEVFCNSEHPDRSSSRSVTHPTDVQSLEKWKLSWMPLTCTDGVDILATMQDVWSRCVLLSIIEPKHRVLLSKTEPKHCVLLSITEPKHWVHPVWILETVVLERVFRGSCVALASATKCSRCVRGSQWDATGDLPVAEPCEEL